MPRLLLCTLTLAALLSATAPVGAHTPPPVYLTSEIGAEELELTCVAGLELFKDWLGIDPDGWAALGSEELSANQERIEAFFAEWGTVVVDGIPVKGVFRSLEPVTYEDHEQSWKFVHVKLAYGTKALPAQVSFSWRRYQNGIGWWLEYIQGEIFAEGFGGAYFELSEKEPEYIWHRPATPSMGVELIEPTYQPAEPLVLPLVSLGILLALLAAVPFFRVCRVRRVRAWAAVAMAGVLAVAFSGFARLEVHPPWEPTYERPDAAQAKQIFASLHRNIYRAFDYTSENDVYDTLARSVKGRLLDRIYGEIRESLIMVDQGGAVSRIQGTRLLDAVIDFPAAPDLPEFYVVSTWQVRGRVTHWGHTHERVNEYRAGYRVEYDGEKWRIADVETLDQRRLDDEEAGRAWK